MDIVNAQALVIRSVTRRNLTEICNFNLPLWMVLLIWLASVPKKSFKFNHCLLLSGQLYFCGTTVEWQDSKVDRHSGIIAHYTVALYFTFEPLQFIDFDFYLQIVHLTILPTSCPLPSYHCCQMSTWHFDGELSQASMVFWVVIYLWMKTCAVLCPDIFLHCFWLTVMQASGAWRFTFTFESKNM